MRLVLKLCFVQLSMENQRQTERERAPKARKWAILSVGMPRIRGSEIVD
jgi:hypothetical protein